MKGCSFVTKQMPAYVGNYTKGRAAYGKIREITVHHAAGIASIDALGRLWQTKGRKGSSHYGVQGTQIGQYVCEDDIAWCNSNWIANCRAVSIEVSNSTTAPNWEVSDASLRTLVQLIADIARRNGLLPLVLGKTLTYHSMYTATACPGPYLRGKLQWLCDEVNKLSHIHSGGTSSDKLTTLQIGPASAGDVLTLKQMAEALAVNFSQAGGVMTIGSMSSGDAAVFTKKADELGLAVQTAKTMYVVQAGFFTAEGNANAFQKELNKKGTESAVVQTDGGFRVQCGAFARKENAQTLVQQLAAKGVQTMLKEV